MGLKVRYTFTLRFHYPDNGKRRQIIKKTGSSPVAQTRERERIIGNIANLNCSDRLFEANIKRYTFIDK